MIFKRNKYTDLEPILVQIYGELNRIRLSMNDPQKAKEIMEFDAKHNGGTYTMSVGKGDIMPLITNGGTHSWKTLISTLDTSSQSWQSMVAPYSLPSKGRSILSFGKAESKPQKQLLRTWSPESDSTQSKSSKAFKNKLPTPLKSTKPERSSSKKQSGPDRLHGA